MNNKDSLYNRMKKYERPFNHTLPIRTPMIIRLDGKTFHSVAKKLNFAKPFDEDLIQKIQFSVQNLCSEIQMNVKLAYMQSDEISLLLCDYDDFNTEPWFDKQIQKICSISASIMSSSLTLLLNYPVYFDARCFTLPKEEVANYFIWRQKDWERNSVQMLGRSKMSDKEMFKMNISDIQNNLLTRFNTNWNDLKLTLKRGSCILKEGGKFIIDNNIPVFTENREYIEKNI